MWLSSNRGYWQVHIAGVMQSLKTCGKRMLPKKKFTPYGTGLQMI